MNANFALLVGRLAAKPILSNHATKNGTTARVFFTVAVTRLGDLGKPQEEQRTNWVPVVAWGSLAERCAQYLDRGTEVTVVGENIFESVAKRDDEGNHIEIDGVRQYRKFSHVQGNSVQFGEASKKEQSRKEASDFGDQLSNLQLQIDVLADKKGEGETITATPPTDDATVGSVADPFEEGAGGDAVADE
jgi:single-stranded DNA-binding protein